MGELTFRRGGYNTYYEDERQQKQGWVKHYHDAYEHQQIYRVSNYKDDKIMGISVAFYTDGSLAEVSMMDNYRRHGEFVKYDISGIIVQHVFYKKDGNITEQVKEAVGDMNLLTDEDRLMIELKFGIPCITDKEYRDAIDQIDGAEIRSLPRRIRTKTG